MTHGPADVVGEDCQRVLLVFACGNDRVMRWSPGSTQASIVAGGHGLGDGLHQLNGPGRGVAIDHKGALLVADHFNHRVMRWAAGATKGSIAAGGHGPGDGLHQLEHPQGITVDDEGALLVADAFNHRVMRWAPGATHGSIVAGGHGCGDGLHQLCCPTRVIIDHEGALLVVDSANGRVMRWAAGATQGSIVAGGDADISAEGITIDRDGALLVADYLNHRIMRWAPGASQGSVVAGSRGKGDDLHQLSDPCGITVDREGALLVADAGNHRVMRWASGAMQGSIVVDKHGHGLSTLPWAEIIEVCEGILTTWSPAMNSAWPHESRLLTKVMLLVDARRSRGGLAALGPLLLTEVLPWALPGLVRKAAM